MAVETFWFRELDNNRDELFIFLPNTESCPMLQDFAIVINIILYQLQIFMVTLHTPGEFHN